MGLYYNSKELIMINKTYITPNGALTSLHIIRNLEVNFISNTAIFNISSFPNVEAYNSGLPPLWSTPLDIPLTYLVDPIFESLEQWAITYGSSFLSDGIIMADTSLSLESAKGRKWSEIKVNRLTKEYGGFIYDGSVFDSDEDSTRRIVGATTLASLAKNSQQPFSIDWTLADNSVRTLNADSMIGAGEALGQYVASIHAISRTLRDQIENATTVEEVTSIHWPD